jgi:hypothetical protein
MNFFNANKAIKLSDTTCMSGGAAGSDTYWCNIGKEYNVKTKAFSYKTGYHNSNDKVEISDEDYNEGIKAVHKANKSLKRYGFEKYINLLARNWAQVKYSDQIFAIGTIVESGKKSTDGYYNKSKYQIVSGGTGWAVQMAVDNTKQVYVFDQKILKWFEWSFNTFKFKELLECPIISKLNFAGIGTREITEDGINAIKNVYIKTSEKYDFNK